MRRLKPVLIAAVCGAIIGVIATKWKILQRISSIPFFAKDYALLGHSLLYYACLGCWVVFSLYWDIASRNSAPAKSSETKASRGLHVFLANAALILIVAPIHGLGRFLPASSGVMVVGFALEVAGYLWRSGHDSISAATGVARSPSSRTTN